MKWKYVFLGVSVVCGLSFFAAGRFLHVRSAHPANQAVHAAQVVPATSAHATAGVTASVAPTPAEAKQTLRSGRGADVFSLVFADGFLDSFDSERLASVRQRFSRPYPAESGPSHSTETEKSRELRSRLGILMALSGLDARSGMARDRALTGFYGTVATNRNENLFVRRQAVRNLASLRPRWTESERNRFLSEVDSRVTSLATMNDSELVERFLHGSQD